MTRISFNPDSNTGVEMKFQLLDRMAQEGTLVRITRRNNDFSNDAFDAVIYGVNDSTEVEVRPWDRSNGSYVGESFIIDPAAIHVY